MFSPDSGVLCSRLSSLAWSPADYWNRVTEIQLMLRVLYFHSCRFYHKTFMQIFGFRSSSTFVWTLQVNSRQITLAPLNGRQYLHTLSRYPLRTLSNSFASCAGDLFICLFSLFSLFSSGGCRSHSRVCQTSVLIVPPNNAKNSSTASLFQVLSLFF